MHVPESMHYKCMQVYDGRRQPIPSIIVVVNTTTNLDNTKSYIAILYLLYMRQLLK